MILRTLRVEGFRCFANPVQVGRFSDGLNILHGPNRTGKSTLLRALLHAMFDSHKVGGERALALKPWGRELNPEIVVEFEHEGQSYRLQKRFLASQVSELCRLENGSYVRLAQGEAADVAVRKILAAQAPSKGISDQRNWGFAQVLWAPQGAIAIPQFSADITSAIQKALGVQLAGEDAGAIERKISAAYLALFTPKGKLKGGENAPRVAALENERDDVRAQLQVLNQKLHDFETASRQIEDLRNRRNLAAQQQEQLTQNLRQTQKQVGVYQGLVARKTAKQAEESAAKSRYDQVRQRFEEIKRIRAEQLEVRRKLTQLELDSPAQQKLFEQCRIRVEQAQVELAAVRTRREEVDRAERKARQAERFAADREKLMQRDALLAQLRVAFEQLELHKTRRGEYVAPDTKALNQIVKAAQARDRAQGRLEASMITVSVLPEVDLQLELLSGDQPGSRQLGLAQVHSLRGSPEVSFKIPGLATFRATGPQESVEQLRAELERATADYAKLTAPFGTQDLELLQQQHELATTCDQQIAQVNTRVETLLGSQPFEAVQRDRAKLTQAVAEGLKLQPDWEASLPDVSLLVQQADEIHHKFVADVESAEARRDQVQRERDQVLEKQMHHESSLKTLDAENKKLEGRLQELTVDGLDDPAREKSQADCALEWDAVRAASAAAATELAAFPGNPLDEVKVLEKKVDAANKAERDAAAQLHQKEGNLQQLTTQAPYSSMADLEERISRLDESIARERLQIEAVRLLYTMLAQVKQQAVEAVVGPVQRRATQSLHRIAGSSLGGIQLSESFLPAGVRPDTVGESIAIGELSGGEQEQVHLAVRLALADAVFGDQRELVVLDDVLNATDAARLARILVLLDEAAEKRQVIILTCHPENYRGLSSATFHDLEQIIASANGSA